MRATGPWSCYVWMILTAVYLLGLQQQVTGQCVAPEQRIDCHPDANPTEARCTSRGCLWCPAEASTPTCITKPDYGYTMDSLQVEDNGYRVLLSRASIDSSLFGDDFDLLTASFTYESDYRLHIRITPEEVSRFEVPVQIYPPASGPTVNALYSLDFMNSPAFGFQVKRRSTSTVLFDTTLGGFTFADQFLQLAIKLPSTNVYGIGENEQHNFRQNFSSGATYGLYTRDQSPDGTANMYGVQPYYTVLEPDGNAHSVVILNSNAQEFVLHPAPAYIYRTVGGILDIYIFLGPTPEETVQQYTETIGRMPIPHYWALGLHLCRLGYGNIDNMKAMIDRTAAAQIPQDVQYADLDNLHRYLSFTYDPVNFAGLPELVDELHAKGMHFVISTEAYISSIEADYKPLELGNQMDVWIKRPDGTPFRAKVIFIQEVPFFVADFSKNVTATWWTQMVTEFHDVIDYDGLWLDMNEPGLSAPGDFYDGCEPSNRFNHPSYVPAIRGGELASNTICPDAVQEGGLHYDLHSVFALQESQVTAKAVRTAFGKRGFLLSRSNYPGIGQSAAHWLGDNFSRWDNLRASIIAVLQYNQFGVPLVGPDICGFFEVPTEELCTRWLQVGAFYPFSRNHNFAGTPNQDPGAWGPESIASSRRAFLIRYTLLPYLYTLFYNHVKQGGTVARALWHVFPRDPTTWGVDRQFMWGNGLLISPVLDEGATTVLAYFPDSRWYSYYDGAEVQNPGTYQTLQAPFDFINLHVHGGNVLLTQEPAMNTELAKHNPYGLIIALDMQLSASGALYLDDGESIDPELTGAYFELEFTVSGQRLESRIVHAGYDVSGKVFNTIRLFGHHDPISLVIVNGLFHNDFSVDPSTGELLIRNMNVALGAALTVSWI